MQRSILIGKRRLIIQRLALKRYRRRVTRKKYKKRKKKREIEEFERNAPYRALAKDVKCYQDAINLFLPRNLSYMMTNEKCLFYSKKIKRGKVQHQYILEVPREFSIITNPDESYSFLQKMIAAFVYQTCNTLWIDYKHCIKTDLLTQVFLDAILLDIDRYHQLCKKANLYKYINWGAVGGKNYNDEKICRMVNSVGSPTVLINRKVSYKEIVPFRLHCFDGINVSSQTRLVQKEIDTTNVIEYVNKCLERVNKTLNSKALREMGYVVGETLINAEEHSSLNYRYMIGYFEECNDDSKHYGVFNLVIMNFGQSIYEKFKYPIDEVKLNTECLSRMQELSDAFTKKRWFRTAEFTEETLWTLYSLQQGVTSVPNQERGNGTIQFIESFFKLKGNKDVDDVSRMYILSGNSIIEFDGTYRLSDLKDDNGVPRGIISFNSSGSLLDKPDTRYVRSVNQYFPGTAIFIRILLNEDDIRNENKYN